MYMYTNYGYDATTAATYVDGMASDILADLVDQEVLKQKAEAEGYLDYTEEHKKAAQEVIDEDKKAFVESLVEEYKSALEGQTLKGKNEGAVPVSKDRIVLQEESKHNEALLSTSNTSTIFITRKLTA